MDEGFTCIRGYGPGEKPELCDEVGCRCRHIREVGHQEILITCYEIKVSKSDFKSKHGHNFVGNCNYYVIPNELYAAVADLVPEDIGIILYLHAGSYVACAGRRNVPSGSSPTRSRSVHPLHHETAGGDHLERTGHRRPRR